MGKHPFTAMLFVWATDISALTAIVITTLNMPSYGPVDWLHAAVWTILLSVAHLGGITLIGLNVQSGWSVAVDMAALLSLPFPMFCMAMLVRFGVTVTSRCLRRHPEPWVGPDFNTANVLLNASVAIHVYHMMTQAIGSAGLGGTLSLLVSAAIFSSGQMLLLTALLALDLRKPWRKVGSLDADALISDAMMVTAGALVGRIYQHDPYLLVLTLVPLLMLHRTLNRLNEAKMAYLDGKTGLHNYRHFDESLNELFRKAAQTKHPLALVFGDMDHLREVNNAHGHLTGDRALMAVADAFRRVDVQGAVSCRFGGEEFVVLLPGLNKAAAAQVAETLRQRVAESMVRSDSGKALRITVSLGVAAFPEDANSMEELVKAADEAVYLAKHTGRNRVCTYARGALSV